MAGYGRPQHAQCVEMCSLWTVLTCYACHCIALCKAPASFPPRPQQHGIAMAARISATYQGSGVYERVSHRE